MTDLETAIMIKNMARETVKRMTATTKNSLMTKMMEEEIKKLKQTPFYQKHLTDSEKKHTLTNMLNGLNAREQMRCEILLLY